ncbi:MAG: YeiH family protein [Vulcanimicrobiaceae bacterium]
MQAAILVFGATLSVGTVVQSGAHALPLMLGTLVITLLAAVVFAKLLRVQSALRTLIGVGTAICGASAIAAVSTVIEAHESEIAYAITTVFVFNIVAVLVFPLLGHAMHLSQAAFGLWAGTAINDTSSVVAAGLVYGHAAGVAAVIVKLTRTTLIVPIVLALALVRATRARSGGKPLRLAAAVPWFVLAFLGACILNGAFHVGPGTDAQLQRLASIFIVVAMSGTGLSADFGKIRQAGMRPLLLGLLLWVTIAASSLGIASLAHLS